SGRGGAAFDASDSLQCGDARTLGDCAPKSPHRCCVLRESSHVMKSDKYFVGLLVAIYLFAIAIVVIGASSEVIASILKSSVNEQWLGFAGSIIGGLTTAVAGLAAWIAAQRTIQMSQAIAERREQATYSLIRRELSPIVDLFVCFLRVIQRASGANAEVK